MEAGLELDIQNRPPSIDQWRRQFAFQTEVQEQQEVWSRKPRPWRFVATAALLLILAGAGFLLYNLYVADPGYDQALHNASLTLQKDPLSVEGVRDAQRSFLSAIRLRPTSQEARAGDAASEYILRFLELIQDNDVTAAADALDDARTALTTAGIPEEVSYQLSTLFTSTELRERFLLRLTQVTISPATIQALDALLEKARPGNENNQRLQSGVEILDGFRDALARAERAQFATAIEALRSVEDRVIGLGHANDLAIAINGLAQQQNSTFDAAFKAWRNDVVAPPVLGTKNWDDFETRLTHLSDMAPDNSRLPVAIALLTPLRTLATTTQTQVNSPQLVDAIKAARALDLPESFSNELKLEVELGVLTYEYEQAWKKLETAPMSKITVTATQDAFYRIQAQVEGLGNPTAFELPIYDAVAYIDSLAEVLEIAEVGDKQGARDVLAELIGNDISKRLPTEHVATLARSAVESSSRDAFDKQLAGTIALLTQARSLSDLDAVEDAFSKLVGLAPKTNPRVPAKRLFHHCAPSFSG